MTTEQRITALENYINLFKNSATIPKEIDNAFRERLAGSGGVTVSGTGTASDQDISLSGNAEIISVLTSSGTVILRINGVTYEVLLK